MLVTEAPSDPPAGVTENTEECTIEEEVVGSVVVVSKTKNSQVSVRDVDEETEEKKTGTESEPIQPAEEEENKPAVAVKMAENSGSSEEKTSGSVEPAASEEETVAEKHPSFPPSLDDFDLIACEANPSDVEEYLLDPR